ncbi:MAG: CpaD family pilus assembly protein [Rhizobiales bacterium]|nr:CpaD family pilus assembly protein [Hyphomicrobiales bacterium]
MTALPRAIDGRRGQAALRLLAAAALAAMLGGCYQTRETQVEYQPDYRLRHPIVLKEGERSVEVFLGRNRGGLLPTQRADVLAFAQVWRREATGGIIVDVPKGGPNDYAAADSMREIQSILFASGVPRHAIFVRPYRPADATFASIKLGYSKLVAKVGSCGQWPQNLGPGQDSSYTENQTYWNFGCASQRNLAAMADNPADLVQPRGESSSYTARRSVAMDKYRKGEDPSGKYNNLYDTGKISTVGK